jgi:signal transduction histidine kinase
VEEIRQELDRHLRGETPVFSVEHRAIAKGGNEIWILERGRVIARDAGGEPERMVGISSDITVRKLSEKELFAVNEQLALTVAELNERRSVMMSMLEDVETTQTAVEGEKLTLTTAVAAMSEGMLLLNRETEILLSNRAAAGFFRTDEGGVTSRDLTEHSWFPLEEIRQTSLVGDGILSLDVRLRESPLQIAHVTSIPIRQENMRNALVTISDVTKERELDSAKDELITVVSHELRTPLAMIKLFIESAEGGVMGVIAGRLQEGLFHAKQNVERLEGLINDLLDFSRLRQQEKKFVVQRMSMTSVVEQIRANYHSLSETRDRHLTILLEVDNPVVMADADGLYRVIANLIDNAFKFTSGGGHIVLAVTDTLTELRVSVEDDGLGVSAQHRDEVFNRFKQVGRTYGPGERGLGLGLAICKEIVEGHGGRIWVEDRSPCGSRFVFTIPREKPPEAAQTVSG